MTAFCDALNGGKDIANRKCVHEPFYVSDRRVGLCSTNNASVRRTIALKGVARQEFFQLIALRKSAATNFFGPLPQEIGRHKLFRLISSGNRLPQTFSAHFLGKSLATKLFQLISSGNRPPQNFSAHFLRKSAATKLFQLISSGNRRMAYIELTLFLRRTHVPIDAHGKAPF